MSKECGETLEALKILGDPEKAEGMTRYGISKVGTLGVSMPALKELAKGIGVRHGLAIELWQSGVHEARILAALVAEPSRVDRELMEAWVHDFDSWDVCDQVCSYLFSRTRLAYEVIPDWTRSEEEFVRRAGFVMIAVLAVHDKKAGDEAFLGFFHLMEQRANDDRNYVKKAINWAIRQIGKRNLRLREECMILASRIQAQGSPSARWIASDALRELSSKEVERRLESRSSLLANRDASVGLRQSGRKRK
jgi:3-methyladenine DNA glycosylase AlkD